MSKVWYIMLLGSVSALLFTDPGKAVTAMIAGSHAAVKLAIDLAALYGFWLGFFGIIEKAGIADFLSRLLGPVVRFLFPGLNKDGKKYVTMNMAANLLGLGNASTPMAIKAIKEMDNGSPKASQNMIMLTVISATSLQLLPTTVIGMRATHGSAAPADFLLPATVATVLSTIIGITLVKLIGWIIRKRSNRHSEAVTRVIARSTATKQSYTLKAPSRSRLPRCARNDGNTPSVISTKRACERAEKSSPLLNMEDSSATLGMTGCREGYSQ